MNNIKYNVIIVIFVLIFIGYFYLENNVFTYKNVKTKENFQASTNKSNITNSMLKTVLEKFFDNMKSINKIAKKQIIPKISLPHGVPLFTKHPKSYDNAKRGLFNNDCEKIILPSKRWMKECVEFGVPSEKLDVIGVLLLEIEEEDLIKDPDMKIDNLAERKKLWKAIYSLKKAEDTL